MPVARGLRAMFGQDPSEGLGGLGAVLGIGTDLVSVRDFAEQIGAAGSVFLAPGNIFSPRELRRANQRAEEKGDSAAEHLAALWAIKEAAVKAWVSALEHRGLEAPLHPDQVKWAQITVTHSASGAPNLRLTGTMAEVFEADFGGRSQSGSDRLATPTGLDNNIRETGAPGEPIWLVSASHDGDYAAAFVILGTHA